MLAFWYPVISSFTDYSVGCYQRYLEYRDFRVNLALRKLRMIEHFILIVNIDTRGLSRRYNIIQMHIILKYSCEVFNGMTRNDISK